jgi:hypothetical protein
MQTAWPEGAFRLARRAVKSPRKVEPLQVPVMAGGDTHSPASDKHLALLRGLADRAGSPRGLAKGLDPKLRSQLAQALGYRAKTEAGQIKYIADFIKTHRQMESIIRDR